MILLIEVLNSLNMWIRCKVILCSIKSIQAIPGNDQSASPTNQKTAGNKLDRTS